MIFCKTYEDCFQSMSLSIFKRYLFEPQYKCFHFLVENMFFLFQKICLFVCFEPWDLLPPNCQYIDHNLHFLQKMVKAIDHNVFKKQINNFYVLDQQVFFNKWTWWWHTKLFLSKTFFYSFISTCPELEWSKEVLNKSQKWNWSLSIFLLDFAKCFFNHKFVGLGRYIGVSNFIFEIFAKKSD